MSDSPDNMALTLLREMRRENNERFDRIESRLGEMEESITDVVKQMMGVSSILMLIHGNSLTLEGRVAALENLNAASAE